VERYWKLDEVVGGKDNRSGVQKPRLSFRFKLCSDFASSRTFSNRLITESFRTEFVTAELEMFILVSIKPASSH